MWETLFKLCDKCFRHCADQRIWAAAELVLGSRNGRQCNDITEFIRAMLAKAAARKLPLYVLSMDFSAAYDQVKLGFAASALRVPRSVPRLGSSVAARISGARGAAHAGEPALPRLQST